MEAVMFGLVLAAGAAAVTWWAARTRTSPDGGTDAIADAGRQLHALERETTVVLDLSPTDVDDERVQRLVRAAAASVFAQEARVQVVTVQNRAGIVLGRVPRNAPPLQHVPELDIPARNEGGGRGRTPTPVSHRPPPLPELDPDGIPTEPVHRDLAETFDLPDAVRRSITDPGDGLDIVEATLRASGHETRRQDDVLRTGEHAFLVLDGHGRSVLGDALNRAYLRFSETGASHGYVIVLGFADRRELDRRQALAPQVSYLGREAIQRMADAVALGADPLSFVRPPVVEIVRPSLRSGTSR